MRKEGRASPAAAVKTNTGGCKPNGAGSVIDGKATAARTEHHREQRAKGLKEMAAEPRRPGLALPAPVGADQRDMP
jgi:hypothetical protein